MHAHVCVCLCIGHKYTCLCACMPVCMWLRASRCSFSLCQCNVYISGEASINFFLHVETRSYERICMLMYVYMCTAVGMLCWVGVLWLLIYISGYFDQVSWVWITLIPRIPEHPLYTHITWLDADSVCYCAQHCLHAPVSLDYTFFDWVS